ncbi:uncharacterized protein [Ptychodera flava]|uniref:uncharacterized protein n=1 Tax=Ptychodera flava TaxID=63121 RepID=UPI00396A2BAB
MTVKPTNTTTDSLPSHGNSPRNQVTVATSVSASATCQVTVLEGQETATSSVTYQPTTATDQYSKVATSEENTVQVDKTQTLTSSVPISQTVMTSTMSNQLQTSKFPDVPFSPTPVPTQQQPPVYDSACVPTTPQQQRNGPYRIHTCTSVTNTAQSISTQPANKNCNESTMLTQLNSQGIDATDGITSTTPFNSPPSNDSNAAKQGNTGSVLMAALSSQSSGNLTMGTLPPISTVCRRVNMAASNDSAASRPNHTAIHSNMGLWNDTARETTQNIGYPVALSSDHMTSTDVVQSVSNINTTARNYLDATALAQPQNGVSSSVSMETASSSVISVSPATRSLMSPSQPDGVMAVSPIPTTRSNVGIMHMVSPSPNALRRPSVGSTPSTTPLPAGSVPSSPLEHCNNSNPFGFTPIQNGSGFGTTNVTVNNLSPIKPTQRVPTTSSVGMPSQSQATGATRRNSLSQQRQQSYPYSVNRNGSNNRIQMNNAQSGIRNTYLNISKDSHNNGYGSSYGSNVNVPFQPRSNHPPTTVSCSNVNQALTFTSPPDQSHMSGYVSGGNQLQTNTCNQNTAGYSSHGIAALGLATANRSHSAPLPQVIPGSTNGQTPWQLEHQNPQSYAAKRNLTQILETDHMETPLRELELSDADFEIDTVSSHSVGNSLPAGLQSSYGLPHPLTQQYLSNQPTSAYDTTMDDMEANAVFQDFYHTPNRSGTTGTPPSNMNFDLRQWQVGNNDSNSAQTSMSC